MDTTKQVLRAGEIPLEFLKRVKAYLTVNDVRAGENEYYPELEPMIVEGEPDQILQDVREAFLQGGDCWTVTEVSEEELELTGTVETSVFGFVDDFTATIENTEGDANKWAVVAQSSSRIGEGDFGKNARNIRNFYRRMRGLRSTD